MGGRREAPSAESLSSAEVVDDESLSSFERRARNDFREWLEDLGAASHEAAFRAAGLDSVHKLGAAGLTLAELKMRYGVSKLKVRKMLYNAICHASSSRTASSQQR